MYEIPRTTITTLATKARAKTVVQSLSLRAINIDGAISPKATPNPRGAVV